MPFLEDIGVRDERRPPAAAAFATLADQVERLVAVNLAWSVQIVPAFLALAFPQIPLVLRVVLVVYSVLALAPATGVLFALARQAHAREHIGVEIVKDTVRELAARSTRHLAPLYAAAGALMYAVLNGPAPVQVLAGWLLLCVLVCSLYWGPVFAQDPDRTLPQILKISVLAVLANPGRTLSVSLAIVFCGGLGVLSVGGFFLVVPILVALLQTTLFEHVTNATKGA